jgi:hypothetical protein
MTQTDTLAEAYIKMVSKPVSAKVMSDNAHQRSSEADSDSTLLTQVKAVRAHNLAASAWKGVDDKKSEAHSKLAEKHFDAMTKMIPGYIEPDVK